MFHYLGIDAGSSFTKLIVIGENKQILQKGIFKTLSRNKDEPSTLFDSIFRDYEIINVGVTGYGRQNYNNSEKKGLLNLSNNVKSEPVIKTELFCASRGITELHPIDKTIIDIGGEDVKIIKSGKNGKVLDFYMNTKCAAGTGAFISEVAERADINVSEMSSLAQKSTFSKELNSFCTVFAKTEIMQWILDDLPVQDIAKGIYLSIVNRIKKIQMDKSLPVIFIGGVAGYHPYLKNVMEECFSVPVTVPGSPQYINAYGAALYAMKPEYL